MFTDIEYSDIYLLNALIFTDIKRTDIYLLNAPPDVYIT